MDKIVDVVIADPRWGTTDLAELAEDAVDLALGVAEIETRAVEVAVLACNDAEIATLNSAFRGRSSATNVLSWPALDLFPGKPGDAPLTQIPATPFGPAALGNIAIAYETVVREAEIGQLPLDHHILHLILHASLHLLGYDHQTEPDAERMEQLEVAALALRGIPSPY